MKSKIFYSEDEINEESRRKFDLPEKVFSILFESFIFLLLIFSTLGAIIFFYEAGYYNLSITGIGLLKWAFFIAICYVLTGLIRGAWEFFKLTE